jgi:hypothetical protein
MSDENKQPKMKDSLDQVKSEPIEQKAQEVHPNEFIDLDQRTPRGRRPLFRS